jgi:hypothetical protein
LTHLRHAANKDHAAQQCGVANGRYGFFGTDCSDHSGLMPAALMIGHHFPISAF